MTQSKFFSVLGEFCEQQQEILIRITAGAHLGNLVGAIRPAIKSSGDQSFFFFLFLADYHSLIKSQDPNLTHGSSLNCSWLACGLEPKSSHFIDSQIFQKLWS